jgi:hypothetical protein
MPDVARFKESKVIRMEGFKCVYVYITTVILQFGFVITGPGKFTGDVEKTNIQF